MGGFIAASVMMLAVCASADAGFTAEDEAAVRALEEAYRTAWLANDSAAVMATLARGAVMMPAGVQPLVGESAIRRYWWPSDGSETTIESYELAVEEVDGIGDLAYLRGRGSLEFTYRDAAGEVSRLTSESVHLSIARRVENAP
jgi:ketosteroid isomerase-like protein